MPDYRLRLILESGLNTDNEEQAKQAVLAMLPNQIEFGPEGAVLPFEVIGVTAEEIDWDTEPRP